VFNIFIPPQTTEGQLELQHGTIFIYLQSFTMYANFSSFQQKALDLGASCDVFTLRKLCELDLPSFDVGWPAEGTFDLPTAYQVERVILGWPGHPNQILHILT
jgi:hypothetical protein